MEETKKNVDTKFSLQYSQGVSSSDEHSRSGAEGKNNKRGRKSTGACRRIPIYHPQLSGYDLW